MFYSITFVDTCFKKHYLTDPWSDTTGILWETFQMILQTLSWDFYLQVIYTHKTETVTSFFLESKTRYQLSLP